MRVLVTGGEGFMGRLLVDRLATSHEVWATCRQLPVAASGRVSWLPIDLTTPDMTRSLPQRIDVVVHLAQSPHYRAFPEHALDVFDVNVSSTLRLLDWARSANVRQFILASSGGVGSSGQLSYYLASKQCAELLAGGFSHLYRVLTLRFFFVYGPGQRKSMLVPRLIDQILNGRPIELAGANGPRLNPIAVRDATDALIAAIDRQIGGRIDIAGPEVLTIRAMCETIGQQVGRSPQFISDEAKQPADLVGDIETMSRVLTTPQVPFNLGVSAMLAGN